jgi:hypothetical protein
MRNLAVVHRSSKAFASTLAAVALLCLPATAVQAQTLEGEIFQQTDPRFVEKASVDCYKGVISFSLTGPAIGPEAGTFAEQADIQFDQATGQIMNLQITLSDSGSWRQIPNKG